MVINKVKTLGFPEGCTLILPTVSVIHTLRSFLPPDLYKNK